MRLLAGILALLGLVGPILPAGGASANLEEAWREGRVRFDGTARLTAQAPSVPVAENRRGAAKPGAPRRVAELKEVLSTGRWESGRPKIQPFGFRHPGGAYILAQSAGLEGFLYTKKEIEERFGGQAFLHHLPDYFQYLETLLSQASWTGPMRARLRDLRDSGRPLESQNAELNVLLGGYVSELQEELVGKDSAQWVRRARIYEIFPRAYNLEGRRAAGTAKGGGGGAPPGSSVFFRDFRAEDLEPIRRMGFDTLWPMGIFPIGERSRWGTGGGSPYSIRDHGAIHPDLGTEEDFRKFVKMCHAHGFRVIVDFVANHTSKDSVLLGEGVENFIHRPADPERPEPPPEGYFIYTRDGRTDWVHHGGYESFGKMETWVDTAQLDYSRPETRRKMAAIARSWVERFDVDGFRVDMAYQVLNSVFSRNWKLKLPDGEFLAELIREVRSVKPSAAFIAEAYGNHDELSSVGFDLIYSKTEYHRPEGQTAWYDATVQADGREIQSAVNRAAFLAWQKGGSDGLTFVGNHDERSPQRAYGPRLAAAALTTLLLPGPTLFYGSQEIGFDRAVPWEHKSIPFSVPVKVDWQGGDPEVRQTFETAFREAGRLREELGDYDLSPLWPAGPGAGYVLRSKAHPGRAKAVVANLTNHPGRVTVRSPRHGLSVELELKPGEYRILDVPPSQEK